MCDYDMEIQEIVNNFRRDSAGRKRLHRPGRRYSQHLIQRLIKQHKNGKHAVSVYSCLSSFCICSENRGLLIERLHDLLFPARKSCFTESPQINAAQPCLEQLRCLIPHLYFLSLSLSPSFSRAFFLSCRFVALFFRISSILCFRRSSLSFLNA
jgi:hypothetical protein